MLSREPPAPGTRLLEHAEGGPSLVLRRAQLVVLAGPDAGLEVAIDRTSVRVGKDPENDVVLRDETVSARHFELATGEEGCLLRDLGSTNGTFLEGYRAREVWLRDGAEITVGRTTMRFCVLDDETVVPVSRATNFGELLGHGAAMRAAFAMLERAAKSDATVLVVGESGTGKELAARGLHDRSPRQGGPFVVFDCGAASPSLVESQLFGHARGAFTGAIDARSGVFEDADGGTLILDELGELPLDLQPKLLRALESRQIQRVGESKMRPVDVRFVACTNRNLEEETRAGRFRQDLYFRVSVVTVRLPPLRERREEIPRLVRHFLSKLGRGVAPSAVPQATLEVLMSHDWPGNARELRNFVERWIMMPEIDPASLVGPGGGAAPAAAASDQPFHDAKRAWTERFEREYLTRLFEAHGGNVSEAARTAGLSRQTCYRLMQKHGLRPAG